MVTMPVSNYYSRGVTRQAILVEPSYRSSTPEMSLIETLGINVVLLSFVMYVDFNYFKL